MKRFCFLWCVFAMVVAIMGCGKNEQVLNLQDQNQELVDQIQTLNHRILELNDLLRESRRETKRAEFQVHTRERFIQELNLPEAKIFSIAGRMAILEDGYETVTDILDIFKFEGEGSRDLYSLFYEGDWQVTFVKGPE